MQFAETKYTSFYFDLEDTIIDTYIKDERIVNSEKVKKFISENKITNVSIFSFVMQDASLIGHFDDDLHYNKSLRQKLEEHFDIKINGVPSLAEMIRYSSKLRRMDTISMRNYFDFFSKERAFIDMVKHHMKFRKETDIKYILIDDMVDTQMIEFGIPDKKVYAYLINVNDL